MEVPPSRVPSVTHAPFPRPPTHPSLTPPTQTDLVGRWNSLSSTGFQGITLTWLRSDPARFSIAASSWAWAGESLTPESSVYSKLTRRPVRLHFGKREHGGGEGRSL